MGSPAFNVPIDIPWKRLAASSDMIDMTYGDAAFPPKWRSSVAIFYHEPDDLPPSYCDRRITYLKISCTITGYQLDQKEIEFEFDPAGQRFSSVPVVIRASGSFANNAWPLMALRLGGQEVERWEVSTSDRSYRHFVSKLDLSRGSNTIEVAFLNDYAGPEGDRNLFIDLVTIGEKAFAPTDAQVQYLVRDQQGNYLYSTRGQRAMYSQGELQFLVDYEPQDWLTQYIKEYDSLGAYLPCYGVILHAAVFPSSKRKEEVQRQCTDFSGLDPNVEHANPLEFKGIRFTTAQTEHNQIRKATDFAPAAFDIRKETTIEMPAVVRHLQAKLYHSRGTSVVLQAFKGDQLVASMSAPPQPDQPHALIIDDQEFDRVLVRAPQGEAWLTEICFDHVVLKDLGLEDYPYIMAFEPQKREMYETVNESGEAMSRSLSNINVRKGFTSTESEEVLDIDTGWSFAQSGEASGPMGGGGGSLSLGRQGQWGTRNVDTEQREDVRTTDVSRERREVSSHSTTLSQLYHLFNGYHLGTNRSLFFMLPRPHVTEVKENGRTVRTFANGPRRIEGVQEVFLVVNRPKSVPGICVETLLETAHLDWEVTERTDQPAPDVTIAELERFLTEKYKGTDYQYWHTGDEEHYEHYITSVTWDSTSRVFGSNGYRKGKSHIIQNGWGVTRQSDYMTYEEALALYYKDNPDRAPEPVVVVDTKTSMILTARSTQGCLPRSVHKGCVEQSVPENISQDREWISMETKVPVARQPARSSAGNQFVHNIGQKLKASFGSRERYTRGDIDFLQTDYALSRLRRRVAGMPDEDPMNKPLEGIPQLDPDLRRQFSRHFPNVQRRKQALEIPTSELRRLLRWSEPQVREFQLLLLGVDRGRTKRGTKPGTSERPDQASRDE
jgi:hypothetical protein